KAVKEILDKFTTASFFYHTVPGRRFRPVFARPPRPKHKGSGRNFDRYFCRDLTFGIIALGGRRVRAFVFEPPWPINPRWYTACRDGIRRAAPRRIRPRGRAQRLTAV